jgi:secreted trypsin-like serine protease
MARVLQVAIVAGILLALAGAGRAEAIVGGTPVGSDRWPWMVGLLDAYTYDAEWAQFCGGAVIAPRRVLTAAHCVANRGPADVKVLLGRTRLTESGGRAIAVTAITLHPDFASRRHPSLDAAVLTLARDAGVPPLALAPSGSEWASYPAWTMGWGALHPRRSPGGSWYYADRLREVQIAVVDDATCENSIGIGVGAMPYRPQWLVCAGTGVGERGPCFGDSGAPLVVQGPAGWVDVGVLSGGDSCATPGYYDLYTRVATIRDWALGTFPSARTTRLAPPRVAGRLAAGAVVRCRHPRRTGVTVHWRRLADRSGQTVGRGRRHRLSAAEARSGITCTVTTNRRSATARPLRPT